MFLKLLGFEIRGSSGTFLAFEGSGWRSLVNPSHQLDIQH